MAQSLHSPTHTHRRYRITVRTGAHAWTFAFTPADAPLVLRRVDELVTDPDAPFDVRTAASVRREVLRTSPGSRPRSNSPTEGL